jgi:hypothetical protein
MTARSRLLLAAAVVAAGALAPLALSGTASAANSSQLGALFTAWARAHPVNRAHCPVATCYGPLVESRPVRPEFSFVQTMRHRVVGYDLALRRGTPLAAAELQVAEQMPADISLPRSVSVVHHDRYGHSCAVFDLWSATLAARYGPKGPAGQGDSIGVELATIGAGGAPTYNPDSIDLAIVVPEYISSSSTNC